MSSDEMIMKKIKKLLIVRFYRCKLKHDHERIVNRPPFKYFYRATQNIDNPKCNHGARGTVFLEC